MLSKLIEWLLLAICIGLMGIAFVNAIIHGGAKPSTGEVETSEPEQVKQDNFDEYKPSTDEIKTSEPEQVKQDNFDEYIARWFHYGKDKYGNCFVISQDSILLIECSKIGR